MILTLVIAACGSNSPTNPDPTIEAQGGTWTGQTEQGKEVQFFVTESPDSVGSLSIVLDISGAPDITWNLPDYVSYDHEDGTWEMQSSSTVEGHTHTISISGTFTASNVCSGSFTATSETYWGGYYLSGKTFAANPQ